MDGMEIRDAKGRFVAGSTYERGCPKKRFWGKVRAGGADECWIWTSATISPSRPGNLEYGNFWFKGRARAAHRVAWELANGPIPHGGMILHKCDVPLCVNPRHLYLGTAKDNSMDAVRRGRLAPPRRGGSNGNARLSDEQASQILSLKGAGVSGYKIADRYGVSSTTVYDIWKRKIWPSLDGLDQEPLR